MWYYSNWPVITTFNVLMNNAPVIVTSNIVDYPWDKLLPVFMYIIAAIKSKPNHCLSPPLKLRQTIKQIIILKKRKRKKKKRNTAFDISKKTGTHKFLCCENSPAVENLQFASVPSPTTIHFSFLNISRRNPHAFGVTVKKKKKMPY